MSRSKRTIFATGAAVAVAVSLAFGSVAAQDDSEAMGDMASMEPMEAMEPGLYVRDAWTRESMMVDLAGAAYMVIHNNTDADDALIGARAEDSAFVSLHRTDIDAAGTATMSASGELTVPARGELALAPGGAHLMLDVPAGLAVGDTYPVTMLLASGNDVTVDVAVVEPGDVTR